MYTRMSINNFIDWFERNRFEQFTYEGLTALFDYLEYYEEETGEEIEFDPIAICSEFSEFESADQAASEHFDYEGMEYDEEGNELLTCEEVEEKALQYLYDNTTVIEFDSGIIVADF